MNSKKKELIIYKRLLIALIFCVIFNKNINAKIININSYKRLFYLPNKKNTIYAIENNKFLYKNLKLNYIPNNCNIINKKILLCKYRKTNFDLIINEIDLNNYLIKNKYIIHFLLNNHNDKFSKNINREINLENKKQKINMEFDFFEKLKGETKTITIPDNNLKKKINLLKNNLKILKENKTVNKNKNLINNKPNRENIIINIFSFENIFKINNIKRMLNINYDYLINNYNNLINENKRKIRKIFDINVIYINEIEQILKKFKIIFNIKNLKINNNNIINKKLNQKLLDILKKQLQNKKYKKNIEKSKKMNINNINIDKIDEILKENFNQ